ncbi:hypothetical protein Ancab_017639 [Ancistrocladus abbreviatus]
MNSESLDKVLVKHISRLEKDKLEFSTKELLKAKMKDKAPQTDESEGGLEQILVKHKSKLEKEKIAADPQWEDMIKRPSISQGSKGKGVARNMGRHEFRLHGLRLKRRREEQL